jgi:hypothetical protein
LLRVLALRAEDAFVEAFFAADGFNRDFLAKSAGFSRRADFHRRSRS